jgi:hypothetical protein
MLDASDSDLRDVSSKESKHVGFEPTGSSLILPKDMPEQERALLLAEVRRIASINTHRNIAFFQVGEKEEEEFHVFSDQYKGL